MMDDSWQQVATTWVRRALTVALLVAVWRHAHWSVAVALTLLAADHEATVYHLCALWRGLAGRRS